MTEMVLLQEFTRDVIQSGPESTLPCNLSDKWLYILANSLEQVIASQSHQSSSNHHSNNLDLTLITIAIQHIFLAKSQYSATEYLDKTDTMDFQKYFESYRMEIALESITRATDISINPANIHTILTNREVNIEHKN